MLTRALGVTTTTTLAHHPMGNAKIERLWQYVVKCLRQLSPQQHRHWQAYVPLIEHTWNTTVHSVLGVSPFEAAHGLPARVVADRWTAAEYNAPSYMDGPGIKAMQTTAKAFMQLVKQVQTQAAMANARCANLKGTKPKLAVGDRVAFFIPPTADEAEAAKRKAKHMLWFRGPAIITDVMSPTTFTLKYKGREYKRCLSELRPFKAKNSPDLDMGVAADNASSFKIGTCVAYSDTDDPEDPASSRFHLGKCVNIADGMAHVHCYATHGNALSRCKWGPLYQNAAGVYAIGDSKHGDEVIDKIPVGDDGTGYVHHYDVRFGKDGKLAPTTRRQLAALNLQRHRLGHSFP